MPALIPRDFWDYRLRDLFCGLAAALGPSKTGERLSIPELGDCVPIRSGRAALVIALQSLKLRPGARVGVPLFCCPVVFKAIAQAGCELRFIDVNPATFSMSAADLAAKASELEAVIAVHMFGNPCDMPALQAAAGPKPIIEDCAQSLGSKLHGRPTGAFGAAAIFSFRSGKYLSAGEGGALFSKEPELLMRASELAAALPRLSRVEEGTRVGITYLKSRLRSRPWYGLAGYALWNRVNQNRRGGADSALVMTQINQADLALTRRRLGGLNKAIEKQRANAAFYLEHLELDASMLSQESSGVYSNRHLFPITFPSSAARDFMAGYLLAQQCDTMKYLDQVVEAATEEYGYAGDCPAAEQLTKRVLILPSYYVLQPAELERIAQAVNAGWALLKKDQARELVENAVVLGAV